MNRRGRASGPSTPAGRASNSQSAATESKPVPDDTLVRTLSRRYGEALRAADSTAAKAVAFEGLRQGLSIGRIHAQVIQPAMYWIGDLWRNSAISVGDEHLATAISEQVLAALYPKVLEGVPHPADGRVLLAAVAGEQHALGLRMTADVFEGRGHEVLFMGADSPTASILAAVDRHQPAAVGLSITMDPNLSALQAVLEGLSSRAVKVAVGGQAVPSSIENLMPGVRSVVDLPHIADLPWASDVRTEAADLMAVYRRDQQGRNGLLSDAGGVEASLSRVATESIDLARAAIRQSHLAGTDGPGTEDQRADAQRRSSRAVVREVFEAINAGDKDAALRLIDPNAVWAPSMWSGAGTLRGRDEVRAWLDRFGSNLEELRISIDSIKSIGGWVVALGTVFDTRDGGSFATTIGWHFAVSDGAIKEGRSFANWAEALEAAGHQDEDAPLHGQGNDYFDF